MSDKDLLNLLIENICECLTDDDIELNIVHAILIDFCSNLILRISNEKIEVTLEMFESFNKLLKSGRRFAKSME